jgi:hypothetical protein
VQCFLLYLGVHRCRLEAAEASHALSEAILERLVHRTDIVYHAEGRKNKTGVHLEAVTHGNKGYPPVGDTSNVFVSSRAAVFCLAIILRISSITHFQLDLPLSYYPLQL